MERNQSFLLRLFQATNIRWRNIPTPASFLIKEFVRVLFVTLLSRVTKKVRRKRVFFQETKSYFKNGTKNILKA